MNKINYIIIIFSLVIGFFIILLGQSSNKNNLNDSTSIQNVEILDNIQYITINAQGGYSPRLSVAEANIPTKLIMKTNGTYDCSLALVIRSIGYQKMLSPTGEEIIDLGMPQKGRVQGLCSMGMYGFVIDFE